MLPWWPATAGGGRCGDGRRLRSPESRAPIAGRARPSLAARRGLGEDRRPRAALSSPARMGRSPPAEGQDSGGSPPIDPGASWELWQRTETGQLTLK